ncbi:hypothetical protein [Kineosporia sp. NBRC 101731]|uniref:hypothetical protein n=1 Tax=Kineosporia sp. NBRC 101731 TaxID=3032199 RepID=UPI0024A5D98C|nr:hypothetical protein [Kineosporia sp. NBRC 101731]GLY32006.1 hypothetical protein Kisp02_53710 [Kineosporia sp. NBRC 101731]
MGKSNDVSVEVIDPARATALLATQKKNRLLGHDKVKQYAGDMKAGRWRSRCSTLHIDWNGALIDGQHRLHAVIAAGLGQEFIVSRGHDPDDQNHLDNGKNRTAAQQMGLNGVPVPGKQAPVARNLRAFDEGALQASMGNRSGGAFPAKLATMEAQKAEEKLILWAIGLAGPKAVKRTAFSAASLHSAAAIIVRQSELPAVTAEAVEEFFDEWLNPKRPIVSKAITWLNALDPGTYTSKPGPAQVGALIRSWNDHRGGHRSRSGVALQGKDGKWIPFPDQIAP